MIWLACMLFLIAAAVLVLWQGRRQNTRQLVSERLLRSSPSSSRERFDRHLHSFGQRSWVKRYLGMDEETLVLLRQAGFSSAMHQGAFFFAQVLAPVLLVLLAMLLNETREQPFSQPIVVYFLAAGVGYLLPKRILKKIAEKRQQQLIAEVSVFIPLVRILFSAGLTVEQSLRILSQQGRTVLPLLSGHLSLVLRRVDSGLALQDELESLSRRLGVDELSDCLAVLRQLLSQGGAAIKALQDLKKLMDDRRLTQLQEKISKMSAKMSVVMMVFLFPALLIVLAGPGMRAIGKALGGGL